jgi:hypothetical protein
MLSKGYIKVNNRPRTGPWEAGDCLNCDIAQTGVLMQHSQFECNFVHLAVHMIAERACSAHQPMDLCCCSFVDLSWPEYFSCSFYLLHAAVHQNNPFDS